MKKLRLKLNAPLGGFPAGREIEIDTDNTGVPLEKYWRDRIKDSAIDHCVSIVKKTRKSKQETDQ